jgi:prepilin-type N-terminal cleavage/methylation domain-containing protein
MLKRLGSGFTLIEFVMVIVIIGLLSTMVFRALTIPMHAFEDLSRRTELVSTAETALSPSQLPIRSG